MGWLWAALSILTGLAGGVALVVALRAVLLPDPYRRFLGFQPVLAALVRWRLGPYRRTHSEPDAHLPTRVDRPVRVAVVGAGIAGIAASSVLAERGVAVTLIERNTYLGGKIGAWPVSFADGGSAILEHGFHAFFRHYYNFERFLTRLGLREGFRPIGEYVILRPDGSTLGFGGVEKTPGLNIIDLALRGMFDWRAIVRNPASSKRMEALLRYDRSQTYARWDQVSFADFAEQAGLDPDLALSFNTFSRAFFADPDRMSMAELVKSFHFYYLSHAEGLDYDFPVGNYHTTILEPIREHLERHGVDIQLGVTVGSIERKRGAFRIGDDWFDAVVLAADVPGVRGIWERSADLSALDPGLAARMGSLKVGQRYAVWRLWLDRDVRADLPVFVITDRVSCLDSITFFHRYEPEAQAWVGQRGGGSVLELHCYAVPDGLVDEDQVKRALWDDVVRFLPTLEGASPLREGFQLRKDFPAFHCGLWESRPEVTTEVPGLYLAGDWVKLPFPAMLMEAAFSSGLLAANAILSELGVQQEPVYSVPLTGLLAGLPEGDQT